MSDSTWTVTIVRSDDTTETIDGLTEAEAAQYAGLSTRDPDVVRVGRATG